MYTKSAVKKKRFSRSKWRQTGEISSAALGDRARFASADSASVNANDRHHGLRCRGDESLPRVIRLGEPKRALDRVIFFLLEFSRQASPASLRAEYRHPMAGDDSAGPIDDPGVARGALGDEAVLVDEPGLTRARPCAASLARQAGSSITVLMSQRCQRMSGIDLTAMPARAAFDRAGDIERARQTTVGVTSASGK